MFVSESKTDERDYSLSQYIPRGVLLTQKEYILPLPDKSVVLNQYTTPSCVGHACAMAKMITEYMLTNKWIGLSPYSIFGYYDTGSGGMGIRYGVEILHKWGCLPLSEFSCVGKNPEIHNKLALYRQSNPSCDDIAARYRIDNYAKIRTFDEAKQAISIGMPVIGAVMAQSNFGKINGGLEPKRPTGSTTKHAICFVGWKDIEDEEYLIAINSYGEENGDNGMVYIPKGRNIMDLFSVSDAVTPVIRKCSEICFKIGSSEYTADGVTKSFESAPYIKGGRTYLPIRFVSENLGASVAWDAKTSTATIRSEEATVVVSDKSDIIEIDGERFKMDVKPEISNGRMMAPIRHLSEALNCEVEWTPIQNIVTIRSL